MRAIAARLVNRPSLPGQLALVRELPNVSAPLTAVMGMLVVIGTAIPTIQIWVSSSLISAVPGAARSGMDSPDGRRLLTFLIATAVVLVGSQIVGSLRWTIGATLGARVGLALRERVIIAVQRPPGIAHLEDPKILDHVSGASGLGTGRFPIDNAVGWLASSIVNRLGSIGPILLLARFRWWGAALMVAGQYVARRIRIKFAMQRTVALNEQNQVLRRADYFRDLALTPVGAKETRVFGLENWVTERFHASWLEVMRRLWRRRRGLWPRMLGVDSFLFSAYLVNLLSVAFAFRSGEIDLRGVALLVQAVFGSSAIVQDSANFQLLFSLAPLIPLDKLEAAIAEAPVPGAGRDAEGLPVHGISFDGVSFRYPGLERDVVSGLDLEVYAGRSLAIVGPNGAGKTTLVKLLARLHEPTGGRITVDGVPLDELDIAAWRRQVAVIFQDYVRYQMPARDNVGFGALRLAHDAEALSRAARRAGAADIIEGLPNAWDTILSRQFTDGADLSGGQWQRVALARALFAVEAGAKVLVLDEPTANLDVRAEADFFDRFLEITHGLTTIVISHRFSTVRRADEIVVLEDGAVIERGTHTDLVRTAGRYAHMFSLQASMFAEEEEAADA